MASPLTRLFGAARARLTSSDTPADGRRQFFRKAGGAAVAAAGAGLLLPDDAWASVEARANEFGIVPGTVVDANGRRVRSQGPNPFLGEISLVGWNFAARGWALCEGQLLPINANQALFSLLGTTYGGDGRTTFALPDLRGRAAMHFGTGPGLSPRRQGERAGNENTTLTVPNLAAHSHPQPVHNMAGSLRVAGGNIPAGDATGDTIYSPVADADATLGGAPSVGGNVPFSNVQPFLVLNYQIATQGVFPSRN